ncbi:hypothetical protein GCM10018787_04990 [Streptomyces thermodiastaticus]|nr:hypothetical protein GCM10018787_04990 [Streptomyces thermodiastaticus]
MPLTDAQWARIEPLLPDRTPKRGGRWRDHREVIDAIAYKFQTGTQWVHLPEKYGNWRGVYNRLRMWAVDGTWERVFTALVAQADADEDVRWAVSVDSTIVRAHQHAAGAREKGAPADEPRDHAIGRSRGGLTTKIHLVADGRCRPLAFQLTAGQAGDAPAFTEVMTRLRVPRRRGRPRTRPDVVLADRATPPARSVSSAQTRHPGGDPGTGRPAGQPEAARTGRWQATGLRPGGVQAVQHRRAVHQPPEAVARYRHPLRQY